jgi:hypothetical protein
MQVPTTFNLDNKKTEAAAQDALWLIARLAQDFPGIVDTETEVSGSDLVDWLTYQMQELESLKPFAKKYYIAPEY